MIIETTEDDYAAMLRGAGPRGLLWLDPPVAPPEILAMLADVAAGVRVHLAPASWPIVARTEDRRVGRACVRTCRTRWLSYRTKNNQSISHLYTTQHCNTLIYYQYDSTYL